MRFFAWTIFLLMFSNASYAALGGAPLAKSAKKAAVIASTSRILDAPAASVGSAAASISKIDTTLSSGTVVHEYVSSTGTVFAVSWRGPVQPDLKELLGQHFTTMVNEARKSSKSERAQLVVNHPEVVIAAGGHMRAFEGRAWIPAELPAGFTPADIH